MRILSVLAICLVCGCKSTNFCDSQALIDSDKNRISYLSIQYLEDKPTGYLESHHSYTFPIVDTIETINKTKDGYIHSSDKKVLFGCFMNVTAMSYYDHLGAFQDQRYGFGSILGGGVMSRSISTSEHHTTDELSIAFGSLFSKRVITDKKEKVEQYKYGFLFNSFGIYSTRTEDYFTILGIPVNL